jgi:hypothetical protein
VIHYEIVVLDPEQFTSMVQMSDVDVLFERRVAVVNTQSQHRSRKKWWIDTTSCAGAIGWPHGCSALEKYRSDGKKFARIFF